MIGLHWVSSQYALTNPCVTDFLESGGAIEGISRSPDLSRKSGGDSGSPVLYAYRRINCTEMLVLFDINVTAKNSSRFNIEFLPSMFASEEI